MANKENRTRNIGCNTVETLVNWKKPVTTI